MKQLLAALLALLLPYQSFAALGAQTIWEFRSTASANMVNGGGYNPGNATPGTDYSQQDAAEDTGSDLASSSGTTNPCVITSASHNFVDADEGNIIHITAGTNWTAGWYEIVSTAANAATLDRACGAAASISGGTWYLGGSLSLNSLLDDEFFEQIVPGNTVYFRYGTYQAGEAINIGSADGTASAVINITGYNSTRGDDPVGDARPTIAGAANTTSWAGDFTFFSNFILTTTAANGWLFGTPTIVRNCKSTQSSGTSGRIAIGVGQASVVIGVEAISTNGNAISMSANGTKIIGSYIHDSNIGVNNQGADYGVVAYTIFDTIASTAIAHGSGAINNIVINNTFYGSSSPAGTAIKSNPADGQTNVYLNNIIYGWENGIAYASSPSSSTLSNYNQFYNNTNNYVNVSTGTYDSFTDPSFTDAANGDFRVGTNSKAIAFPGLLVVTTGYLDVGAAQRVEPAASGGGTKGFPFFN